MKKNKNLIINKLKIANDELLVLKQKLNKEPNNILYKMDMKFINVRISNYEKMLKNV